MSASARTAKKNKKKRAAKLKENSGRGGEPELTQSWLLQQETLEERQRRECTIKLDNVDFSLEEADVYRAAEPFGKISQLALNRGHAFVEYTTPMAATSAYTSLDGAMLGKRALQTLRWNPSVHGALGARRPGGGRGWGRGRGRAGSGSSGAGDNAAGARNEETVHLAHGAGVRPSKSSEGLNVLASGPIGHRGIASSAESAGSYRQQELQHRYRQQLGLEPQQPRQQEPPTGSGSGRPGGIDMTQVVADHSAAFEFNNTWSSKAEHRYMPKKDDFPALGLHKAAPEEFPSLGSAVASLAGRSREPEPEPEPEPESKPQDLELWTDWDVGQVGAWLSSLNGLVGKDACIKAFADNSINGPALELLDNNMLKDDLGITALGDRLALTRGIQELQSGKAGQNSAPTSGQTQSASPRTESPRGRSKSESKMIALMRDQPEGRESFEQVVVDAGATDPLIVYTQQQLGDGATGQVFEGSYRGMLCAVKRMSATERSSLRELEAYRSGSLRHPSLVHYHTCKMEHGLLYLAMDRCSSSLSIASPKAREFLAQAQRDPALQRRLAKQLMEGLTYLHSAEVSMVHRDLKPSNVLVDIPDSGEPRLLICDMGLSKRRDAVVSMSTLGDDVGTLGWKAPIWELNLAATDGETHADALQAGAASDIFSAGLVLFHLLSGGSHPFDTVSWDAGESGSSPGSSGSGPTTERKTQTERQARIAAWGSEWQKADVEERAQRQLDFMEQLQSPRPKLAVTNSQDPDRKEDTSPSPSRALLGARGNGDGEQHVLSPEAASLIAMMLHPDPTLRIKASQTLVDPYFKLFELQEEDEIPKSKLSKPWRPLQGARGAFGVVYRSSYKGCEVAVKRIIGTGAQPQGLLLIVSGNMARGSVEEDFCREVQLLRNLRHPNIVLFMGWCRAGQDLCIVTELCAMSVEAILHGEKQAHYSTTLALTIAKDAAQGMAFLHEATPPVVHRDLKPANLLVDRAGRVKVCDFGLARRDGAMTDGAGTANYLAPEILLDRGAADTASDVYSYGVVLLELFTRQRPFVTKPQVISHPDIAHLQMSDYYRGGGSLLPIEGFPSMAGEALPAQVAACLALREKRPRFAELAVALEKILRQFKIDQKAARGARAAQ